MIRGPFLRLFNDTPQSMSTSIGLTSGVGTSLKNLTYSCKYSAGETLKVWFARGVIAIASEGNAELPICSMVLTPLATVFQFWFGSG